MPKADYAVRLLVDSGVFSAWNKGGSLSLKDYITFIKDHKHLLWNYVNFDVIPGQFGQKRSTAETIASAEGSYKNLQTMKDAGLSPIPVFHQEEPLSWLERLLKDGEPYIGISSAKDLWVKDQQRWLDQVFGLITDSQGRPLVKTHGFGLTRPVFFGAYPWATVDSTTWSLSPSYGKVFVTPMDHADGEPDYSKPAANIIVSGREQKSASSQKMQFEGLGPTYRAWIEKFLAEEGQITSGKARHGPTHRRRAVLLFYKRLCESHRDIRFKRHRASFFDKGFDVSNRKPVKIDHVELFFATSMSRNWGQLMTELGISTRLLNYYDLRNAPEGALEEYVKKGMNGGAYVRKAPKQDWGVTYRDWRSVKLIERLESADDNTS